MKKLAMFALVLLFGCGGGGVSSDVSIPTSNIWIYGRIIDRTTRQAITGATIEVLAGDKAYVAEYDTDESGTTLFTESERFKVEVPVADTYDLRIVKSGYATYRNIITGPTTLAGSTLSKYLDVGDIPMALGFNLTIYVVNTDTGAAISGATVYSVATSAALEDTAGAIGTENDLAVGSIGFEISATTDASGMATLSGLNYLIDYTIVAPALDTDADGDYDYTTAAVTMGANPQTDVPATYTISMAPAGIVGVAPTVVAANFNQYGMTEDALYPGMVMPASGNLLFVFSYPLTTADTTLALNDENAFAPAGILGGAATLDFDGDDQIATDTGTDVAVTSALSAGNTVLTVTPSAALAANGLYAFDALVSYPNPQSGAAGDIITGLLSALVGAPNNQTVYAFADSDTSITAPTADNYNGTDNVAGPVAVCLEFAEAVYGRATVVATTNAGVTTYVNAPAAVNLNTGSLINEGDNDDAVCGALAGCASDTDAGACAATNAIKYAVPLGVAAGDNVAAAAATVNTVTVVIDAIDAADNTLNGEYTLAVQ